MLKFKRFKISPVGVKFDNNNKGVLLMRKINLNQKNINKKLYLPKRLICCIFLVAFMFIIVGYTNSYINIILYVDGKILHLKTSKSTVGKMIEDQQIKLNETDIVKPEPKTNLKEGMLVRVYRIKNEQLVKKEVIPSPIHIKYSNKLLAGEKVVKQKGKEGLTEVILKRIYADGEIIRASYTKSILRSPIPTIVVKGTKKKLPLFFDLEKRVVKTVLTMITTAYSDSIHSCGKWVGNLTSIGLKPVKGVVAVDPSVIPLRTKLYIEGYGYGIAGDVGTAIKGNKIDLCFNSHNEAVRYGRKKVKVYILK